MPSSHPAPELTFNSVSKDVPSGSHDYQLLLQLVLVLYPGSGFVLFELRDLLMVAFSGCRARDVTFPVLRDHECSSVQQTFKMFDFVISGS